MKPSSMEVIDFREGVLFVVNAHEVTDVPPLFYPDRSENGPQ